MRGASLESANSQITIDEKADNELAGRWWVGWPGEGISPGGSEGSRPSVYGSGQYLRDRREVTRLGAFPVEIAAYMPSPGLRPLDQMPLATPEAANVLAAVCMVVTAVPTMTPAFVKLSRMVGQMKVLPFTLRPLWMTPVAQSTTMPVPAAYPVLPPDAKTVPPPVPAQTPVRAPFAESSSSPELGIVQVKPVGHRPLMAVKKAVQSETFGDATP